MIDEIIRLAELGWGVFPVAPGDKVPYGKFAPHGCKDATSDFNQIRRWYEAKPDLNWGLATDGLLVVDIDGKDNPWPMDPEQAESLLKASAICITGSGGKHFYFGQPPGKRWKGSASKLADKVDTRGDGGYVVLPGSVSRKGTYSWVDGCELTCRIDQMALPPDWLVDAMDACAAGRTPGESLRTDEVTGANLIPHSKRNSTLASLAGTMRRVGMGLPEIRSALLETNLTRVVPPLDESEVIRVAESICKYRPDEIATILTEGIGLEGIRERRVGNQEDPGPFPQELLDNLPGFLGAFVSHSVETGYKPQPVLALGAAITLQGMLAGRRVCDERNNRTNVYVLGLAPTGAGKELARGLVKELMLQAGKPELVREGIASHVGLFNQVAEKGAVIYLVDEIGKWLRGVAMAKQSPWLASIITSLMKLFTSANSTMTGEDTADTAKIKVIQQPHCCLYGSTVPESFFESLTQESVEDGWLSRLLVFHGDTAPKRTIRPALPGVPETLIAHCKSWLDFQPGGNLSWDSPKPKVIPTTDEALELMAEFVDKAEAQAEKLGHPLNSLWTRAAEKVAKLALIHACARGVNDLKIDQDSMSWAIRLVDYLTQQLVWSCPNWLSEDQLDSKRLKVLRAIHQAGEDGLTKTDLARRFQSIGKRLRDEILANLMEGGMIFDGKRSTQTNAAKVYKHIDFYELCSVKE